MTKEEYISGYAKINKAYNQIFDALQELMEQGFDDVEIIQAFNYGLNVLDTGLDAYKENYVNKDTGIKKADEEEEADPSDGKKSKGFGGFKVFGGKK